MCWIIARHVPKTPAFSFCQYLLRPNLSAKAAAPRWTLCLICGPTRCITTSRCRDLMPVKWPICVTARAVLCSVIMSWHSIRAYPKQRPGGMFASWFCLTISPPYPLRVRMGRQISDILVDKDEVAMALHLSVPVNEYAEAEKTSGSNSHMEIIVQKVLQILSTQGFPCFSCQKFTIIPRLQERNFYLLRVQKSVTY